MSCYGRSRFIQAENLCVGVALVFVLNAGCSLLGSYDYLQSGSGAMHSGGTTDATSDSSPGGQTNTSAVGGSSTVSGGAATKASSNLGAVGGTVAVGGNTGTKSSTASMGGTAGSAGSGAASGGTTPVAMCEGDPNVVGSATRPQLTSAAATKYTALKYLASAGTIAALVEDSWNPLDGLGDPSLFRPTYTVAADGTGTHLSIQAALNDVANDSMDTGATDTSRIYILVKPGTYREFVCVNVPRPVTLYGTSVDASLIQIVFDNHAGAAADAGVNPCTTPAGTSAGPAGSATFAVTSNNMELKNLTIANDFDEGSNPWASGLQAVALMTAGDRIVLENVRLFGNLCTALFDSPDPAVLSRVYVRNSYIAGDMQFITGRATLVIDNTEIHYLTSRLDTSLGSIMAASTAAQNPFGILVFNSRFKVDTTTNSNWFLLGRSWDQGVTDYVAGTSPNRQIVVRDCWMDTHIRMANPWGNALETVRQYDCHGNRLYEYANIGPGSAQ